MNRASPKISRNAILTFPAWGHIDKPAPDEIVAHSLFLRLLVDENPCVWHYRVAEVSKGSERDRFVIAVKFNATVGTGGDQSKPVVVRTTGAKAARAKMKEKIG